MSTATNPGSSTCLPTAQPKPAHGAGEHDFTLSLTHLHGYAQSIDFDIEDAPSIIVDEPPPLGEGSGPNPARLLGAAVGSCLAASLLFCMRKARLDVSGMRTQVKGTLVRNERGRLRVGGLEVHLGPIVPAHQHDSVPRCLELFEDFCVVTASVRKGLPVSVTVQPTTT
jgi:organic hydroperoxide reductase OsmC/OhrA